MKTETKLAPKKRKLIAPRTFTDLSAQRKLGIGISLQNLREIGSSINSKTMEVFNFCLERSIPFWTRLEGAFVEVPVDVLLDTKANGEGSFILEPDPYETNTGKILYLSTFGNGAKFVTREIQNLFISKIHYKELVEFFSSGKEIDDPGGSVSLELRVQELESELKRAQAVINSRESTYMRHSLILGFFVNFVSNLTEDRKKWVKKGLVKENGDLKSENIARHLHGMYFHEIKNFSETTVVKVIQKYNNNIESLPSYQYFLKR